MPRFSYDGIDFHYRQNGQGKPFVFQHGLGGDTGQPFGIFDPPGGFQMLSLDVRGHGATTPVGPPEKITLSAMADDIIVWLDYLDIPKAIIGGISMGAGISLNLALRYPDRFEGVVLSRPAWLDKPHPENLTVYATIARLIRIYGAEKGLEEFKKTNEYQKTLERSTDSADSLCKQFLSPRAEDAVVRLEQISSNPSPIPMSRWSQIKVPTLVLANKQDTIHCFEYGQAWAAAIPGAQFVEITPKSINPAQHSVDVQQHIETFLTHHFL